MHMYVYDQDLIRKIQLIVVVGYLRRAGGAGSRKCPPP